MSLRRFWLLAAVIAVALLIILHSGNIRTFLNLLSHIRWYVLFGVVIVQLLSYLANAYYYQSILRLLGYQVRLGKLYQAALATNFVNLVFPSAGVSGASYLAMALKPEVPAGKATLAQLTRYGFTFLSFILVLALGFLLVFFGGDFSKVTARLMLILILAIIFVSLLVLIVLSYRNIVELWSWRVVSLVNRVGRLIGRWQLVTKDQHEAFVEEFYHGYNLLHEHRRNWRQPLLYALYGNLTEVGTVYVVFLSFGVLINPGIVIAAYTVANIISLVSVVTGGIGLYEATMVGTLLAFGLSFTLSVSVVLVYRTLNMVLFLPPGFWAYRRSLEEAS